MASRLFFLLFFCVCQLWSQEKLGIVNSNYSSTNSIFLNPSSSADSRTYMQLKLAGVNAYATTNLGHLPDFSVWTLRAQGVPVPVPSASERNKFVLANLAAEGPCFVISKNNIGAGFFVRGRSVFNVRRLPYQVTSMLLNEEPLQTNVFSIDVKNAGFNNLSWLEAGVNFSYIISKRADNMVQLGANVSYIMGINVLYANMRTMRGVYTDSVIGVEGIDGRMVQNVPAFNSGKGFGVDLGFTYKRMLRNVDNYMVHARRSNCRWIDYKFKLAFSLRDIGYVSFRNGVTGRTLSGSGYLNLLRNRSDVTVMPVINVKMEENHDPVKAMLPLSLSAQFDYNFENYFYVAAVVMKNLVPPGVTGVQSANLLSVIPRFETRNLEVALPLTMMRFTRPQVGFALRLRTLVVGVDNVFPLLIPTNVSTFGIYANLGISLFRNPGCKVKGGSVDDCIPGIRIRGPKQPGLIKRLLSRNKTYSK